MAWIFFTLIFFGFSSFAQTCPETEDEPSFLMQTKIQKLKLFVCGFEDHDVETPVGKKTFSEFAIFSFDENNKKTEKLFASDPADTFWLKATDHGMELEELWFFSEKPHVALKRNLVCANDLNCKLTTPVCTFKKMPSAFPQALNKMSGEFKSKFEEDAEELLDQIFALALSGNKQANAFFQKPQIERGPFKDDDLAQEAFTGNKRKLAEVRAFGCR